MDASLYTSLFPQRSKKRKRTNLDGYSPAMKEERRKILNRVAAQQSRDRKKSLVSTLERKAQELATENVILKRQNEELLKKHHIVEKKYTELLEKVSKISKSRESAVLPIQPQRVICLILAFLALNFASTPSTETKESHPQLFFPTDNLNRSNKQLLIRHSVSHTYMAVPVP